MSEKSYNIEEALEKQGGVFNQTYDLKIVEVGETKEYDKRDGSGKFKVQALQVTDGTAEIKYSIFDPEQIFKEGGGIHAEGVYIKEKDGYTDLKVKRGSTVTFSDSSDVKVSEKKAKPKPLTPEGIEMMFAYLYKVMERIEAKLDLILKKGE